MFQELKKELIASTTEAFKKLIRLGVKLGILVMGCWMLFGAFQIGIFVPTHILKMMDGSREESTGKIDMPSRAEIERAAETPSSAPSVQYQRARPVQRSVATRNVKQPDIRSELRNTRNVMGEVRRMGNALQNFVKV
ncbi:MAG: hypothetical protein EXS63_03875 [Candidatus Omnitrophica bacterium]|nr:hypothetical protein [Candidatus Omnitrophota bacterium]